MRVRVRIALATTTRVIRGLIRRPTRWIGTSVVLSIVLLPSVLVLAARQAIAPPLLFADPQRLVVLRKQHKNGSLGAGSFPCLSHMRHSRTVDVAGYNAGVLRLESSVEPAPQAVEVEFVTANYFSVLKVRVQSGRPFTEAEADPGTASNVALVSDTLWRQRFGADRRVLGSTIRLDGRAFEVVGIMEPRYEGFTYSVRPWIGRAATSVWVPLGTAQPRVEEGVPAALFRRPDTGWIGYVGRIREGYDLSSVEGELGVLNREIRALWPASPGMYPLTFALRTLESTTLDPKIKAGLAYLRNAGLLVCLLGAVNVGGILFARGLARAPDAAVEMALGKTRALYVFERVLESSAVGLVSGVGAIIASGVVAHAIVLAAPRALEAWLPALARPETMRLGARGVVSILALAVASGVAAAILPAVRLSREDLTRLMCAKAHGGGFRNRRPLFGLRADGAHVLLQVTLSLLIVVPVGLVLRSLMNLTERDAGFKSDGVGIIQVGPEALGNPTMRDGMATVVLPSLKRVPGVDAASWAGALPLSGSAQGFGAYGENGEEFQASVVAISPDYFHTLGVPLRAGRDFESHDVVNARNVAVLSESAARMLGGRALGTQVRLRGRDRPPYEVVGIVGDVLYRDLAESFGPTVYIPALAPIGTIGHIAVRTRGPMSMLWVRDTLTEMDASFGRAEITTMDDLRERALARFRFSTLLLGIMGGLASLLTAVGAHGLVSSSVTRARRDLAIRMTLGAAPNGIRLLVVGVALGPALVGFVLGLGGGALVGAYFKPALFEIGAADVASAVLWGAAVVATALAVAAVPALRAPQLNLASQLRPE